MSNPKKYALDPSALEAHFRWVRMALQAVRSLMFYDRNLVRLEQRVIPTVIQTSNSSGGEFSYIKVKLSKSDILNTAIDMGCHSAFFVPVRHIETYKSKEPLPDVVPSGWVPLGHNISRMDSDDHEYQISLPNNATGISGQEGLLVIRPNSGNDILHNRLMLMEKEPGLFPLHLAAKVLFFPEENVQPLGPIHIDRLLGEQLECAKFFQTNETTFIWGPPGTGKSVTLTAIIELALQMNMRVLVLATTNDAIDSITEKLHRLFLDGEDPHICAAAKIDQITRYGATRRSRKYMELSYSFRQARKKNSGMAMDIHSSMLQDQVSLTTLYRFLHQPPLAYDVVIVDEAGAVNLPLLYCAAATAIQRIVICGDPRQTQPIFAYNRVIPRPRKEVQKLFSTDIYSHNKFRVNPGEVPDPRLCKLKTQFRMVDQLAAKVRLTGLYPEYLTPPWPRKWTPAEKVALMCQPLPQKPFVLIDTSALSSPKNVDNTNMVHFELGKALASYFMGVSGLGRFGITTPYTHQASLYSGWVHKQKLHKINAGTIHRFQGSEETLMIFDTVESPPGGSKPNSHAFSDDIKNAGLGTINILNVAVSRGKAKFLILMNVDYVMKNLTPGCFYHRVVEDCGRLHEIVPAQIVLNSMGLTLGRTIDASVYFDRNPGRLTAQQFNAVFAKDVKAARNSISIRSKTVDRNFIYAVLPWLYDVTKHESILVILYLPGNMKKADQAMVSDICASRPTIQVQPYAQWADDFGHAPFIVLDGGRLVFEATDGADFSYLAGQIPVMMNRFIYALPA